MTMKTSISKTQRIPIFSKGLVHCFGQKFEILLTFVKLRKSIFDFLFRKQAFLNSRNMGLKKGKLWFLLKGIVHYFCQNVEFFFIFCVYRKSIEKKCLFTF